MKNIVIIIIAYWYYYYHIYYYHRILLLLSLYTGIGLKNVQNSELFAQTLKFKVEIKLLTSVTIECEVRQ